MKCKLYQLDIRDLPGIKIKPEAKRLNHQAFFFRKGWVMDKEDTSLYAGETAMIPHDSRWPAEAPGWIASGDLTNKREA